MPWWYPYDAAFHSVHEERLRDALLERSAHESARTRSASCGSGRFFGYVKVSTLASRLGKVF